MIDYQKKIYIYIYTYQLIKPTTKNKNKLFEIIGIISQRNCCIFVLCPRGLCFMMIMLILELYKIIIIIEFGVHYYYYYDIIII